MRAQREREERRRRIIGWTAGGAAAVVLAGGLGYVGWMAYDSTQINGLREYGDLTNEHVAEEVDYKQSPPVGGDHHEAWQNCGVYDEPLKDIHAVHSLEHGAVWITYDPDLPADQVKTLAGKYTQGGYVLVSPYEGDMPKPIVASAWGKQVALDDAGDDNLEKFLKSYEQSTDVPEPGAACSGAVDQTAAELEKAGS
ncbi:uncharacterized protein DUF3105 [Murinocardiopsis flavida]|uniref:Uncharacterized protein DUF3105 n=2 Tax=Murinocardiopsis flavida TaxID=645275 RepID=A0A2P8DPD1_9ACTN|nr:uncharacterized protein DUF3105 [Murinocardiopsis flavida]